MAGLLVAGAIFGSAQQAAVAQTWPTKPVRIIVPFPPGGGTDIQGRLLAQFFSTSLGQSFLVDNRSGASGLIGAELVARATPDGYTYLMTSASISVNATLYRSLLKFDPVKDLQAKRLLPLGVTSDKRVLQFPEVPAIADAVPGYEFTAWVAAFAPTATPPAIVETLNAAFRKTLMEPGVASNLSAQTLDPMPMSATEFAQRLESDYAKYAKSSEDQRRKNRLTRSRPRILTRGI